MKTRLQRFSKLQFLPRWTIFAIDLLIVNVALLLTIVILHNFRFEPLLHKFNGFLLVNLFSSFIFLILRTYKGIVRLSGTLDALRLFGAMVFLCALLLSVNIVFSANQKALPLRYPTIVVFAIFAFFGLASYRIAVKLLFKYVKAINDTKRKIIIYGAGETGISTKRALETGMTDSVEVVCFVDDNSKKVGKSIDGIKILSGDKLANIIEKEHVDELVIASLHMMREKKNAIVDVCLTKNISVYTIPPLNQWINGQFSSNQLKNVRIEDLLDRDPIMLYNEVVSEQITNKVVMITGAAGSIGSEIVRQCVQYKPKLLLAVDIAESALHELELELKDLNCHFAKVLLVDVRNLNRLESVFRQYKPSIVYHAAAYKHVPMMEHNPIEAVLTNVKGSKQVADMAVKYDAERMIMVSTDKAVNPTNVMGASKRIAEIYVQSFFEHVKLEGTHTKFITTRFGNVLGSNGSVIPRFKAQIEKGGPVTVTHPEITRYFMTIPEACQLVLEAGSMGNGGEIFVFDMGKSVKIADLARKMIQLSGFTPEVDIKIEYSGLRPGEKLYEELLASSESTKATYHEKIMIAKTRIYDFIEIDEKISGLINCADNNCESVRIVSLMKALVPEFVSNNSVFEKLDDKKLAHLKVV